MSALKQVKQLFNKTLLILSVFSLVVNGLLLTAPLYMLQVYDRVLPSNSFETLIYLSIIVAIAFAILGLLEIIRSIIASRLATQISAKLGGELLATSLYQASDSGGDIQALRDLSTFKQLIVGRQIFSLLDVPFFPLFVALLYFVHPLLCLITALGAVALIILAIINQRINSQRNNEANMNSTSALSLAQSLAHNSDSIRSMGMVRNSIDLWGNFEAKSLTSQLLSSKSNAISSGISKSVRMGLQSAIMGVGAYLVLNGQMTAGMIFASTIIAGRGLQPIDQIIGGWPLYINAWKAWKRFSKYLETYTAIERQYIDIQLETGGISIQNALVVPEKSAIENAILKRVSFELESGKILAIIGPSGAGKSTLIRAIAGILPLTGGRVAIDGNDIKNLNPDFLGKQIGYVSQEVELLPDTIARNISRMSQEINEEALVDAAKKANAHELIKSFPNSYETPLGPHGQRVSGGQRQRIALARAFYGNPKILLLDEPNSHLDEEGTNAILNAMDNARKNGLTVVFITQRQSDLNIADMILRMDKGQISFFGSKKEFNEQLENMAKSKRKAQNKSIMKFPTLSTKISNREK